MKLHAYKFQGAGNDFVIIDNPDGNITLTEAQIRKLCDRRFGIGADGLMTVSPSKEADFSMRYYNSDGLEGLMCGNGGRCISAFFAKKKAAAAEAIGMHLEFDAADGRHCSDILESPEGPLAPGMRFTVKLKMLDLVPDADGNSPVTCYPEGYSVDTGCPHFVMFVKGLNNYNVDGEGRMWRYDSRFPIGTNVDFVEPTSEGLVMRTYERGVECETLACGTGAVAVAVVSYACGIRNFANDGRRIRYEIIARGDRLKVDFLPSEGPGDGGAYAGAFHDLRLTGPATFVFETEVEI